jgi:hypothetical protein
VSAKVTVKTQMKDAAMIVEALKLMGIPADRIQQDEAGMPINGYRGKNWGLAHILVPKAYHRGLADIGFVKNGDTYDLHVDHIDTYSISRKLKHEGRKFEDVANQWYAAAVSRKTLVDQGFNTRIQRDGERLKVLASMY